VLAKLKAEFADKEKEFKAEIDKLKGKIRECRDEAKEKAAELSMAFASSQNEYPNLEDSQRIQIIRKDT